MSSNWRSIGAEVGIHGTGGFKAWPKEADSRVRREFSESRSVCSHFVQGSVWGLQRMKGRMHKHLFDRRAS